MVWAAGEGGEKRGGEKNPHGDKASIDAGVHMELDVGDGILCVRDQRTAIQIRMFLDHGRRKRATILLFKVLPRCGLSSGLTLLS